MSLLEASCQELVAILCKLFQKSDVARKEQLNIIHAILQNRDPLHAHAECKSRNLRRIVIHKPIHIRIDHAAAQQFNPPAGFAVPAWSAVADTLAVTENAADLQLRARLGERKERRIKPRLDARSKHRFHCMVERAL